MSVLPQATPLRPLADPGVLANARLTATTGIALFLLFAMEGVTILSLRRLIIPHAIIGFLLIPPVLLKLGSTGYRFVRYYSGQPSYRQAGPPDTILRVDAPVVVASTCVVFLSGVALWVFGTSRLWLVLHKGSFIFWLFATGVHVLGYLDRAPRLALSDVLDRPPLKGTLGRRSLIIGSLVLGTVLAVVMVSGWLTPFHFAREG